MNGFRIILFCLAFSGLIARAELPPTHNDLRYSEDYERCTLDLWLPESGSVPAPIVVLFHGGGFVGGNKEANLPYRRQVLPLLKEGVAVASVGYPFLGDQGKAGAITKWGYFQIFRETAKSIRYLQEHAAELGIDPDRIAVGGMSAGAMIAEYLTYAEPLGISVCLGLEQPYAVELMLGVINAGDAPLILCTYSTETDNVHHPRYARALKDHCDQVGVTSYLYGSGRNGLPPIPEGRAFIPHAMTIIRAIWAGQME